MATANDIANRVPITIAMMMGTLLNSLDMTIANVALPNIRGSLSAAPDQITWVLTSYLIATAIMTPLSGWLAARFGMKQVLLISMAGFTLASMLCGLATDLGEIVVFRVLQGACGAALIPLAQAIVLDLYPPRLVGRVMALWGMASMLGPVIGPSLGGWLTDSLSWRWVFFINLPVGALAFALLFASMSSGGGGRHRPFDFLGFGALTIFVGGVQLVLDRGPSQDWFSSPEIWTEAIIALIGLWVFVVQTVTAEHPFFERALALDRNFVSCTLFGFSLGIFLFAIMALLPTMMQQFMGYSAYESGLVSMPRGIATFVAMIVVGRLIGRIDTRLLLFVGLSLSGLALSLMTGFNLSMSARPIIITGIIQGFGSGLIFVPLSALAFTTISPALRAEAASLYNVSRSLGSGLGISVIQAVWSYNLVVAHADMAGHVDPTAARFTLPSLAVLNGEITREAAMVGYLDAFRLMLILTVLVMPLILVMKRPANVAGAVHVAAD